MKIDLNWWKELDPRVKSARKQREEIERVLRERETDSLRAEYRRLLKEVCQDIRVKQSDPDKEVRARFCRLWRRVYAFDLFDIPLEEKSVRTALGLATLFTMTDYYKNTIVINYGSIGNQHVASIVLGFLVLR